AERDGERAPPGRRIAVASRVAVATRLPGRRAAGDARAAARVGHQPLCRAIRPRGATSRDEVRRVAARGGDLAVARAREGAAGEPERRRRPAAGFGDITWLPALAATASAVRTATGVIVAC